MELEFEEKDGGLYIKNVKYFNVNQTFSCGQCFRFETDDKTAEGTAFGKHMVFKQIADDEIYISPCTEKEYHNLWEKYLGFDKDYEKIRCELSDLRKDDEKLQISMERGKGIRILAQEPWETLCSFIISQNNNIPRIKKIIAALCSESENSAEFPSPEKLISMGIDGIFAKGTGFRAKYLYDAAMKVHSGEVNLNKVFDLTTEEGAEELCKIKGVGPKVAACTLLFGFGKTDAFPIDVWVKRVMAEYYDGEIEGKDFGKYAGLAQQYLFYNRRYVEAHKN